MDIYRVIGLMSGSSLDGLDVVYCQFAKQNDEWQFKVLETEVIPFSEEWIARLKEQVSTSAIKFCETDAQLGHYLGECVNKFIDKNSLQSKVDLVASHGHTIFHFPGKKFTTQIGDGSAIAAKTKLPVVCNFRTADVALGGQGTPIVPIGDKLLFSNYLFCLNMGGIANISCKTQHDIVAFDICSANQTLNLIANKLGREFDNNGALAQSGKLNEQLFHELNELAFYKLTYPKSLDNSFTRNTVFPLFEKFHLPDVDLLRTYTEHIAAQISSHINTIVNREKVEISIAQMLVTGGGAFNSFLMERIKSHVSVAVVVPEAKLVKFKEALVMALMGVLRTRNEVNVLSSVTGAKKNSCGGVVYQP